MKLWLLDSLHVKGSPTWSRYDVCDGFMVRAETEQQAREIAKEATAGESWDENPWLNPALTSCEQVFIDGEPGIVMSSFRAG